MRGVFPPGRITRTGGSRSPTGSLGYAVGAVSLLPRLAVAVHSQEPGGGGPHPYIGTEKGMHHTGDTGLPYDLFSLFLLPKELFSRSAV